MSKSNRNNPKRSSASESRYTLMEFERDFPDDAACLDWLVGHLYPDGIFCPKCQKVTKHHRVKTRTCYACQFCGHQEYPMKGTIFEDSATSLRLWFHAFYLMAQTRCGISAKQLERDLGVTYKTAWRMFHKIRSLLEQDYNLLSGTVEIDDAYMGGRAHWKHQSVKNRNKQGNVRRGRPARRDALTPVLGIAERGSPTRHSRVYASVVPDLSEATVFPPIHTRVLPASTIYTDEWKAYEHLDVTTHRYHHSRIRHSQKVYVDGDVHTNTIEGFWSLVKRGISGVYHGVSTKHLQSYLDEYVFRYNNRDDFTGRGMFDAFLSRIRKTSPESVAS